MMKSAHRLLDNTRRKTGRKGRLPRPILTPETAACGLLGSRLPRTDQRSLGHPAPARSDQRIGHDLAVDMALQPNSRPQAAPRTGGRGTSRAGRGEPQMSATELDDADWRS